MPRRKKSITTRKRSQSAPASLRVCRQRSEKRKVWTDESMKAAMKAVTEGESVNQAARNHGVPKTTLLDRTTVE